MIPPIHVAGDPFLGAPHGFGVGGWDQVVWQSSSIPERLGRCEEPALEFSFRQDNADVEIHSGLAGTVEELGTESCGAIVIAVDEDQNTPLPADLSRGEFDGAFKLSDAHEQPEGSSRAA